MKRNRTAEFAGQSSMSTNARKKGANGGSAIKLSANGTSNSYKVQNAVRQAGAKVGKVAGAIGANKGKAGMALAGLAAAGGLGMAGLKAVGARKKKASSLQGRLSSAMKKMGR